MITKAKHRRILFLDVDGVLNEQADFDPDEIFVMDSKKVERLNRIVDELGLTIVLSSTWRKFLSLEEFNAILKKNGGTCWAVDRTPDSFPFDEPVLVTGWGERVWSLRGHEIQKWIDSQADKDTMKICIIDDDMDMCHLMPFLVHTTINSAPEYGGPGGIQDKHLEMIREMFRKQEEC